MNLNLTRFSIVGLHGKFDIDIPIYDNRLILIGVNGLGKTTVINFIYFVLSDQWFRLLEFEFFGIELTLDGEEIVITREDIQGKVRNQRRLQKMIAMYSGRSAYPRSLLAKIISHPLFRQLRNPKELPHDIVLRAISKDVELPVVALRRVVADFPDHFQEELFPDLSEPECFGKITTILEGAGIHQVIYLPTYRRIEQDLKAIFPNASEDEIRKLGVQPESVVKNRSRGYVELVQFGMQDVERKLGNELETIQKRTREQLSSLTASYLQDIIRSRADEINPESIQAMTDVVVESVLSRVEENTLSNDDKKEVQSAIRRIRTGNTTSARDQYLTYFFSRLLGIYTDLYSSEVAIRRLVSTCNKYFVGKKLRYDDVNFASHVVDRDGTPLNWRVLSSGEKQVASLFTHLYLSQETSQIVLIDEPELSLSVRWQKNLLPDISNSENCTLLIAVTHSPFIYANYLDKYAVDLSKLVKPHQFAS